MTTAFDWHAGPWTLSGIRPLRKLVRHDESGQSAEWVFEDGQEDAFQAKILIIQKAFGVFTRNQSEEKSVTDPAVEKTTTSVTEMHFVRKAGAPLDPPTNVVYGPIDTANDALIIAHLINEKFDLDEGEEYEAVTRKTTVEVTIL